MRRTTTNPTAAPARRHARAVVVLGLVLVLAACTGSDAPGRTPSPTAAGTTAGEPAALSGEVVVLAAASLTDAFGAIAEDFEATHPGVTVTLGFGASSALAQQVVAGAPADVVATASPATMADVVDAGATAGEPVVVARNRLQIAVPAGNPGGVEGLADLADESLAIALCAERVPCGAAATRVFAAAGITPAPDTLERDVRATLTKVRLGEVDAALVYRTDVLAAGDEVEGIDVPEAGAAVNDYLIVVLADAPEPALAAAFVEHVLATDGRRVLADAGFELP